MLLGGISADLFYLRQLRTPPFPRKFRLKTPPPPERPPADVLPYKARHHSTPTMLREREHHP